jgi:hypothetical protein
LAGVIGDFGPLLNMAMCWNNASERYCHFERFPMKA